MASYGAGARFSKVPETFRVRKAVFVSYVYIQDRGFNSLEGNTTQLLVYETKWTGFLARTGNSIGKVSILKSVHGPERL